jgi:uncharacterized protein (UPF0548 family)
MLLSLWPPSSQALSGLIREQGAQELTYREVGATTAVPMPAGYQHDRWETDLGSFDEGRFARSAGALRQWEVQRGAGLTIFPGEDVEPGATFALVIRLPIGFATAAGRVVYVIDEPGHYGFAYGTLPAHPEQGEEAFHVERDGDRLRFRVVAFSRPRDPLARLGAPVSRFLQRRTNKAYLAAMRQAARLDLR